DRVPLTRAGGRLDAGVTGLRRDQGDSTYYLAQVRLSLERWLPLPVPGDRFGMRLAARAATNSPLSRRNRGELYEVGGARSLRGYREREFQTNAYLLADAELQFTIGRGGRLLGFAGPGLVNRP